MVRLFQYGFKRASIVAVLGCLIISGVAGIDSLRASNDRTISISVNRTNKGDRLPSVAALHMNRPAAAATKLSTPPKGPPLGCDPLFSPIADPVKARLYYRRCAV